MTVRVTLGEVLPSGRPPRQPVARIAVVASLNFPDMNEAMAALVRKFTRVALSTLDELGASFDLWDTSCALEDPQEVRHYDGVLILGGGDIDATCYNAAASEARNAYGVDPRADEDAFAVIRAAEGAGLPVLGICRGAQLLNVYRGGTIIPDIDDFALHRGGPGQPLFLDEKISILTGTRLARILDVDHVVARSGHHQAVDEVGNGLVVAARALDGVIEAVEDPERWMVGVQWHPEDDDGPADDRRALFGAFVAACAARRTSQVDAQCTRRCPTTKGKCES